MGKKKKNNSKTNTKKPMLTKSKIFSVDFNAHIFLLDLDWDEIPDKLDLRELGV